MYDTALDDFMKRFGNIEPPKSPQLAGMSMGADGVGLKKSVNSFGDKKNDYQMGVKETNFKGNSIPDAKGSQLAGAASGALDMAPDAIGLAGTMLGNSFDTSAEGGGVGSGRGEILGGAMQGANLGMKAAGPWGALVGAAVGGGGTALAHNKARKEYTQNVKDDNLSKVNDQKKQNLDDYRMSKGLASIADSKELLKKQLNII